MEFKLTSRGSGEIPYSSIVPPTYARFAISGYRSFHASGDFGTVLLFDMEYSGYSIRYTHYIIRQSTWLQGQADEPMLELHFVLRGPLRYQVEGIGEIKFPEGHFNMVYAPAFRAQAWMESGKEYTTFTVHFSPEYIGVFAPYFPVLTDVLEQMEQGKAGTINPFHTRVTPEMIIIIRDILNNEYVEGVRALYLQDKIAELLLLAFTRMTPAFSNAADIRLHQYDIDKIREAREYLLMNMEHPLTVIELSHKVGINDFKLKKGFKQLYGVTIFDFLLEARIDKAKRLLLETDTPVHEIAFATGYKNVSSFTAAFKKKLGIPPSALKRETKS